MRRVALLALLCAGLPSPASAHRLDEYLQASRVAIDRDRIDVEIDLTPGISVAHEVFASIDADHDGTVSSRERDAYARAVLASLTLELDGRARTLDLISSQVSDFEAMAQGVGVIRLNASARLDGSRPGTHRLLFRNGHRRDIGVYLANPLVPRDPAIRIDAQERDVLQQELRITYEIRSPWLWALSWSGAAAVALAGLLAFRTSRRSDAVRPPTR